MAQRATKFAKKTSRHVEVGALARAIDDPSDDMRAVPLDVLPLLAPFKKRGRLSVRIEKLPIQARLSAGRNNGDHSYSLMLDELEDLSYLAPDGTEPRPVLSVRIISLDDGDAATIAIREITVDFGEEEGGIAAADVRRLIDELTRVKSQLAVREAELTEARMKSGNGRGDAARQSIEEEIAAARATLKAEADARIAKVREEAAAKLAESWAAWQAEQQDKNRPAPDELAKERERLLRENAAALSKAEKDWKTAEDARFARAEAKWREQTDHAVEKAHNTSKAMRDRGDAIELRRVREELMAMQTLLAERDAELAEARSSGSKAPPPNIDAAIAKAEKEWKAAEATRLVAAENRLLERADKALAEARAEAKAARDQAEAEARRLRDDLSAAQARLASLEKELAQAHNNVKSGRDQGDAELRRLRDELSAAQNRLADREKELVQARAAVKDTEERGRKDADSMLSRAEQSWKARESERLAAAEKQWQEKLLNAAAEARAQAKAERDAALSQARERWTAEADAALARAENAWNAREAERLAATEKQWQEKSAAALAEARAQLLATRGERDAELDRLRGELESAKAKLSERDGALAEARAATERAREDARITLSNAEKSWKSGEATRLAVAERLLREQSGSALAEATTARSEAETELRGLRERVATLETDLADRELELTQAIARINATETEIESLRENEDIQVRRVRGEVTGLQEALAERDEELAQARLFAERSYERWQKQAEAELAKAQKAWKSAEASRLAAARAEWQVQYRKSLEDTLASERRAGRLPPVQVAEEVVVSSDIAGSAEQRPLPDFAPPAQVAPYNAPKPLSNAREAADQALDRLAMDAYQLLATSTAPDTHPADTRIIKGGFVDRRQKAPEKNGTVMTAAIAAAVAGVGALLFIFFWPGSDTQPAPQAPAKAVAPTPVAKPVELPKATVLRDMNVRAGPSTSDALIGSLKAGDQIVTGERRGNWVRITLDAKDGKPAQQGWVFGTSLKFPAAEPATPAPAATPEAAPETKPAEPDKADAPAAAEPEQSAQPAPEPEHSAAPALEPEKAAEAPAPAAQSTEPPAAAAPEAQPAAVSAPESAPAAAPAAAQ